MKELSKFVTNSKMKICLVLLYLFATVNFFYNFTIATVEILLSTAVLIFYLIERNGSDKRMRKYMENLSFNIESATHNSVMNSPFPMAITNETGEIIWYNNNFGDLLKKEEFLSPYIQDTFKGFENKKIDEAMRDIVVAEQTFDVYGICTKSADQEKNKTGNDDIYVYYFVETTQLTKLIEEHKNSAMVKGYIYIDNLDELTKNITDSQKTVFIAQLEKDIYDFIIEYNAVLSRAERDRYSFIVEYKNFRRMKEDQFSILKKVKNIESSNLPFTLSIGVGCGENLHETEDSAKAALDLALGRGGDQAVIKENNDYIYFGGNNRETDKRNKVRSRMVALSFRELLGKCEKVMIMGHKNADMDSLGASLGISRIAKGFDKETYIVLEERNKNYEFLHEKLITDKEFDSLFISPQQAELFMDNKTLLVIVDTHRSTLVSAPEILKIAKKIFLIDHHRKGADFIKNTNLSFHEPYASSTSELVVEILQYLDDKVKIRQVEAECLYAGLLLDTQNFSIKTGVRTFEAASYLRKMGMEPIVAKDLIKNDFESYIKVTDIVKSCEFYHNSIAIAKYYGEEDNNIFIAQAADTLIDIKGIKAAFVAFKNKDNVTISARSNGDINVQVIMEKMGGGGHQLVAGAQLKDITLDKAIMTIKKCVDETEEV